LQGKPSVHGNPEVIMKRILGLGVVLLCLSGTHPRPAAAQCHSDCQEQFDLETNRHIGWGCVSSPDKLTICTATVSTCTLNNCGGLAVIRDAKGVLASAELCGGAVRQVQHVAVVHSPTSGELAALERSGQGPRDQRLALAEPGVATPRPRP
jgi:hypothetical protein